MSRSNRLNWWTSADWQAPRWAAAALLGEGHLWPAVHAFGREGMPCRAGGGDHGHVLEAELGGDVGIGAMPGEVLPRQPVRSIGAGSRAPVTVMLCSRAHPVRNLRGNPVAASNCRRIFPDVMQPRSKNSRAAAPPAQHKRS